MLLDITKTTPVPEGAWTLIGDVPKLSACVPGLSALKETEPDHYTATITDKLGPFRLQLPLRFAVTRSEGRLVADVTGNDGRGQARVKGTIEARLEGDTLTVTASIDVLGKLAALGATPMRRRADDIFAEFVRRVDEGLQP